MDGVLDRHSHTVRIFEALSRGCGWRGLAERRRTYYDRKGVCYLRYRLSRCLYRCIPLLEPVAGALGRAVEQVSTRHIISSFTANF